MSESTCRLFFALWPDDEARQRIVARRDSLGQVGSKRVPDHNLHLTLVFLGDQPADRVPHIEAAAADISATGCTLELDCFGWFPAARVLWLGGQAPTALAELQAQLQYRIAELGIRLDRRPFRPHITLFRRVGHQSGLPTPEPLLWLVRDFVLVESVRSEPYRVLARWPLRS